MTFLQKNLDLLKNKNRALYLQLTVNSLTPSSYPVEKTRNGSMTIKIEGQYIHSHFNPEREAEKLMKHEAEGETDIYLMAGFGLGYYLEELHELTGNQIIIVTEPDISFFLQALSLRDLAKIITSPRIIYLLGDNPEKAIAALDQFPGKSTKLIQIRSLYEKDKEFYQNLEKTVKNYISRKEVNLSTLRKFGKLWVRNLSRNDHFLTSSPGINTLKGKFSQFPAMLVAAGPSLDTLKPHLNELKKRFLIVAVDTSLRACLNEGVTPDFTLVADPQYWNTRHLDHCSNTETVLISDTSAYPSVFRILNGKSYLYSSSFPLGQFLESQTEIKGKLKAGGSVATAAWDFCRIIGVSSIWCAGLDLGFPHKQTHCKGSFFEQRVHWLSSRSIPSETFSWHALIDAGLNAKPSNSNGRTWSDNRMALYIRWFEEQMSKYSEPKTWNLSTHGVHITGMDRNSLEEALAMPVIRSQIDTSMKEVKSYNCNVQLLLQLIEGEEALINELSEIKRLSDRGLELSKELKELFMAQANIDDVVRDLSLIDQSIAEKSSREIVGFVLLNFMNDLMREDKNPSPDVIIQKSEDLYLELSQSLDFHLNLMKMSLKKLKNI